MQQYGRASEGDRTMLDALMPAQRALQGAAQAGVLVQLGCFLIALHRILGQAQSIHLACDIGPCRQMVVSSSAGLGLSLCTAASESQQSLPGAMKTDSVGEVQVRTLTNLKSI